MRSILVASLLLAHGALLAAPALAAYDDYAGDTVIYSGTPLSLRPNVLLIVDNSSAAANSASGAPYDPATVYPVHGHDPWDIYQAGQQGVFSQKVLDNATAELEALTCHPAGDVVKATLLASGTYAGRGTVDYPSIKGGACDNRHAYSYALGNYLNYLEEPAGEGGLSQSRLMYEAVSQVVSGARFAVNFGSMIYDQTGQKGGRVLTPVSDLSSATDLNTFLAKLPGSGSAQAASLLTSQTARPQAEALLDAGYHFRGLSLPISGQAALPSPITKSCDRSYVILLTNGMSNKDDSPPLETIVGDRDGDGAEPGDYGTGGSHYLDDVAKYLYESDASASQPGVQRIVTHTILAFQNSDELVKRAANASHGRGKFYNVFSANELAAALSELLNNIVLESDTSFVAPVVPASPENRTASGKRIYLAFFKPQSQKPWHGNVKKYAIAADNSIVDVDGAPTTADDGTFSPSTRSFWSTSPDGGEIEAGGVGEVLAGRQIVPPAGARMADAPEPRRLFSYLGSGQKSLIHADNRLDTDNALVLPETLGLDPADSAGRDELLRYLHGLDPYDADGNGVVNEKRDWLMGDILHSKPLILNYASYPFTADSESSEQNQTYIFVGANDGMLHAFRDRDGVEEWGFVPPKLLNRLQALTGSSHSYFVDGSPVAYIHDGNRDGTIDPSAGDTVVLLFGYARGGGQQSLDPSAPRGGYVAIDASDPAAPRYLWSIDADTLIGSDYPFAEMGESWGTPRLFKLRVAGETKIVVAIGGGYDNNEDLRFGSTQSFPPGVTETQDITGPTDDFVTPRSATGGVQVNPRGRGVYLVEVATMRPSLLGALRPDYADSGSLLWSATAATTAAMDYSFPTDISVLDVDRDGIIDRLYLADTGGQLWRIDLPGSDPLLWEAKRLFAANPGADGTAGRKVFYRPATIQVDGQVFVAMATGDRAHPLNYLSAGTASGAVEDALYVVRDPLVETNPSPPALLTEAELVDVTTNRLQQDNVPPEELAALLDDLFNYAPEKGVALRYGWFVRLDARAGEKVLGPVSIFDGAVYLTSYTPYTVDGADPCAAGNLGVSRLYALNVRTGEATRNFVESGPDAYGENQATASSERASGGESVVLRRADRELILGSGIPSGLVYVIGATGKTAAITGSGGTFPSIDVSGDGLVFPTYWRQR